MNYRNFNLIDFIFDPHFQEWVIDRTEEAASFWEEWLKNNPQKRKVVEQARAVIQNVDFRSIDVSEFDRERVLDHINAAIQTEELTEDLQVARSSQKPGYGNLDETILYDFEKRRNRIRIWYRVAVIVIVAIALGVFAFLYNNFDLPPDRLADEFIEKSCGAGEKLTFKLADGTKVKLNSNSKLIVPRVFAGAQRKVVLTGEAFFDVTADRSRPFVVASGQIATVVHGTSFNVRAFPYEHTIRVAVASGKVSVGRMSGPESATNRHVVLLEPAEMAVFEKDTKEIEKVNFEFIKEIGWKDGIIYFENADIHEVLQTLEDWYGVTFIKNGKINEDRDYTGSFHKKSLEVVLDGLGYVFDFEFEIKGKIVVLN
ncbi:MAG: FecR domain-containing protein [Cytophagales bacterium]|nr:FecR domain-containing protein [Cytophagales bacterium]